MYDHHLTLPSNKASFLIGLYMHVVMQTLTIENVGKVVTLHGFHSDLKCSIQSTA